MQPSKKLASARAIQSVAYLGLGSNLGDRLENICRALRLLGPWVIVEKVSSIYETEPWGYTGQPPFLNAVCRVRTALTTRQLLQRAKEIESLMGREPGPRYGPRPIDIDILLYQNESINEPDLIVPHPRMKERAFVLAPLAEIAPGLKIPGEVRTVKDLASQSKDNDSVRKLPAAGEDSCPASQAEAKISIRQMTMSDYEPVWRLWHLCKIPVGTSFQRSAIEQMTRHDPDLTLVAELNGIIIGAVIGVLHGSQGRIFNHAVDPRCRGRGIGARLFREAERKLQEKGATEIEIAVPRDSLEGRKFFEDVGFKDEDRYAYMVKRYGKNAR